MQATKVSDCSSLQALPVLVAASRSQLADLFSIEFASCLLVLQYDCHRPLVDAVICSCAHQCLLVSQTCHVYEACDQGSTRTCATECCPRPLLLKISNCSPRMLRLRIGRKVHGTTRNSANLYLFDLPYAAGKGLSSVGIRRRVEEASWDRRIVICDSK